ncbi:hypothetical protein MKX01_002314 [Papaver californicum]|nr:hypothetical protein MKX01_002314 [Papaver californicum]
MVRICTRVHFLLNLIQSKWLVDVVQLVPPLTAAVDASPLLRSIISDPKTSRGDASVETAAHVPIASVNEKK